MINVKKYVADKIKMVVYKKNNDINRDNRDHVKTLVRCFIEIKNAVFHTIYQEVYLYLSRRIMEDSII